MMEFFADLHIHSCLSPCADILMLPHLIAERLVNNNIEIASITDHNSLLNVESFEKVFKEFGIYLLPGIEIQSVEEVHILGYFENIEVALKFQNEFDNYIQKIKNQEDIMGYQLLTDENDNYIGKYDKALSFSTTLTLERASELIRKYNGIVVAAHLDKTFSAIKQLGILPDKIFDAVEVYDPRKKIMGYTNLSSSDAHYLNDIKSPKMRLLLKHRNFKEIKLAILNKKGRKVEIMNPKIKK